jgi:hypothetical protein
VSAIHDCLFNICASILHLETVSSMRSLRARYVLVRRNPSYTGERTESTSIGCEPITAVTAKNVMYCISVEVHRRFGGTYSLKERNLHEARGKRRDGLFLASTMRLEATRSPEK